jgi:cation diffusion facilitator family transporter
LLIQEEAIAMGCECTNASARTEEERKTLRIALILNAAMFVIGMSAGLVSQSTGLLADALDMLTDAIAYGLALMAITRGLTFKRNAARWSGAVLVLLGAGIVAEVGRRWWWGSEPVGSVMMAYSVVSFAANLYVLMQLTKYRRGEVHLRASYICTRADVLANAAVFISGAIVAVTGFRLADLLVGFAIGLYVLKEAIEILREASESAEEVKP